MRNRETWKPRGEKTAPTSGCPTYSWTSWKLCREKSTLYQKTNALDCLLGFSLRYNYCNLVSRLQFSGCLRFLAMCESLSTYRPTLTAVTHCKTQWTSSKSHFQFFQITLFFYKRHNYLLNYFPTWLIVLPHWPDSGVSIALPLNLNRRIFYKVIED